MTGRRTPRACESCRKSRRRCRPPFPCQQCAQRGLPCNVRSKARPQRQSRRNNAITTFRDGLAAADGEWKDSSPKVGRTTEHVPAAQIRAQDLVDNVRSKVQGDTFELLKTLLQDLLLERHGYVFDCKLAEPTSSTPNTADSTTSSLWQPSVSTQLSPTPAQVQTLLSTFRRFMGWHDSGLINIEDMHATLCTYAEHLPTWSPFHISSSVVKRQLPADSVALLFVALAMGAVASADYQHGRLYFEISTEVVKHFVGEPTLSLCLTYYLQHFFALRTGTSNYTTGILALAIQNAHDLELHHNTHGPQGLQLYLFIYMADQYCAFTRNTRPTIRCSKLQSHVFAPLIEAKPQLKTLVDLVTINGYVCEHSQQLTALSEEGRLELEAKIGNGRSHWGRDSSLPPSCESLKTFYEPLARVHMYCCRLKLRVPGLSKEASWLPSLCIYLHATEGLLSTYFFQLYHTVLVGLALQNGVATSEAKGSTQPSAWKLPPTWRQVKRIMMSAFMIIYAYWQGEMLPSEATRFMAMARLLLEYPRCRWGDKLNEALQTLEDLSAMSDLRLYEQMKILLPNVSKTFPRPWRSQEPQRAPTPERTADPTMPCDQVSDFLDLGPNAFEMVTSGSFLGPNFDTIEDRMMLGLWEPVGTPIGESSCISNL